MKAFKVPIIVACSALGISLIGAVNAQQPNPEFQLAFCNISAYSSVLVAVTRRQDAGRWLVEGWYPIPDQGCALLGSFLKDTIYYYAYGKTNDDRIVTWSPPETDQTATMQCIDRDKSFRAQSGVPSCPPDQQAARFRMLKVNPNLARTTWTLTGGR